jgi:protein involved in polysaccharide export with SLBB domain
VKTVKHHDSAESAAHPGPISALLLVAGLLVSGAAGASDNYQPFVEPLQVTQKRAYYSAAPAGQDTPLPQPETPLTVEVAISPGPDSESRLESIGRERQDVLRVENTVQDQQLRDELSQFGYDIFSRAPSTFAPVEGIPVPADYRIGPGDNIVVQLFGKRNVEYNLVVTRDGRILIPEFGPVAVGGLTFDDAETLIMSGFEQRVIGARAVVTMGKLRTIQIRVAGDVRQPGIFTIGGLSSLIDALLTTGGVAGTGSLRDIRLIRDGRIVSRLDLYDLLLRGGSDADTFLRHHDTIFVPAIGDIVYVGGDVQRPAIYELRGETTLGEVLAMAGGALPTASLADSLIERIVAGGGRSIIDFHRGGEALVDEQILATPVQSGDFLRILPLEDELDGAVMLEGHVERPGAYEFEAGMRLSTLLRSRQALRPGADLQLAVIERDNRQTLRSEVLFAVPGAALDGPGSEADPILMRRDRVRILSSSENRADTLRALVATLERQAADPRAAAVFELHGALRHTGRMPLARGARLLDAISAGGGIRVGADQHFGYLARTRLPDLRLEVRSFSIAAAQQAPGSDANPPLAPGDRIYVLDADTPRDALLGDEIRRLRERARFGEPERVVSVRGEVLSPGTYPWTAGARASDVLCAAQGLTRRADGVIVTLSRSADGDVEHRELDAAALLSLCAAHRRFENAGRVPLDDADFRAAYTDDDLNPLLQPRDQIAATERPGWHEDATVTLAGEVRRPGVYVLSPGETLCSVLQRAGGLTGDAYAFGAEFTRESVREVQQQTLDELQARLDDLMIELSLSHSINNDEKASHEWAGKQDTLRVIRQLERAEATGRMVVDLDRVQRCRRRDALVLEDGDRLDVPREPNHVQVAGQVYVATAHLFDERRSIRDYIELSGGATVLGRLNHAYVIQANGEVLNLSGRRASQQISSRKVQPGARIYVPLNVDRMNPTEKAQTWVGTLAQAAILAGIVL